MAYHVENEFTPEQKRNIRSTVLGVLGLMVILVGGFFFAFTRTPVLTTEQLRENGLVMFESARQLPEFSLLNEQGESFGREQLAGNWSLVFFGYTYCPDICPVTMSLLKQVYTALTPELQADTRVLLASVDPARDTAAKLAEYTAYFHPDFGGLTGDFLEMHRFATALNTPFRKVPGQGEEGYLVDHSGNVALLDENGHYRGFFKAPLDADKMVLTYSSVRHK